MPGATVVAQPSDAEIKVVKDPDAQGHVRVGLRPISVGKRDANGKLLAHGVATARLWWTARNAR